MDSEALMHLDGRFRVSRGGIIHPVEGVMPTERDNSAIDYLIYEWDYGYSATPVPQTPSTPTT